MLESYWDYILGLYWGFIRVIIGYIRYILG